MKKIERVFLMLICLCIFTGCAAAMGIRAYAAETMTTSTSCIDFIKKVEGFSPQPYYDYNQYTVGYGTKCPTEKYMDYSANGIPKKEAEALLLEAIEDIENTIQKKLLSKYKLKLTQHQFDALVSFSFNVGTGWLTYDSTLRNAILKNADPNDLVYAFGLYCTAGGKYVPGLITRRLCEANIYLNGIYSKNVSDDYGYVYYDANGGTLTYRVQGFVCGDFPLPAADAVRTGDEFLGWYTELTGGTQVTALNSSVSGRTLFARWKSSENTQEQTTESTTVRVTGDVVNIRKGPGTNYGVVKRVAQNTLLTVSHITYLTDVKWGKVQDGWISLNYTNYDAVVNGEDPSDPAADKIPSDTDETIPNDPAEENEDTPSDSQATVWGTVQVNDLLRIRSGPGTGYAVVGFLFNNKEVEILEQETVGSMVWGRISRGWVSMDYIITGKDYEEDEQDPGPEEAPDSDHQDTDNTAQPAAITGKVKADALRIRSGAGTVNPIVGFYYQNDIVTITEKVSVDSVFWGKTQKGWINLDYILTGDSNEKQPQQTEGTIMTVIGDCLRVRKGTGTNYKIAALLYYGDHITVWETVDVDGVLWGKVSNGWICMDYVE